MTLKFEIKKDLHNLTIGLGYSFETKQFAIGLLFCTFVITKIVEIEKLTVNNYEIL